MAGQASGIRRRQNPRLQRSRSVSEVVTPCTRLCSKRPFPTSIAPRRAGSTRAWSGGYPRESSAASATSISTTATSAPHTLPTATPAHHDRRAAGRDHTRTGSRATAPPRYADAFNAWHSAEAQQRPERQRQRGSPGAPRAARLLRANLHAHHQQRQRCLPRERQQRAFPGKNWRRNGRSTGVWVHAQWRPWAGTGLAR